MTAEQQAWVESVKAAAFSRVVPRPAGWTRNILYNFVQSSNFDGFVNAIVLINVSLMASEYYGSAWQKRS